MSRVDIHHRWQIRAWLAAQIPEITVREDFKGLLLESDENESFIRVLNDRSLVSYNADTNRHYKVAGPKGRGWVSKLQDAIALRAKRIWRVRT